MTNPITLIRGPRKPLRGFASMDPQRQREIASLGGKAAHAPGGKGHKWTPEEASAASKLSHKSRRRNFGGGLLK